MMYTKTFVVRGSYDHSPHVAKKRGCAIEKEYRLIRDGNLNSNYIEIGEHNVKELINSYRNGCSLKSILDRCALMSARDKISYLQQTEQGVSADLSGMPKDGTEAAILINKVRAICPDFTQRLKNGETFEAIVSSLLKSNTSAETSADSAKSEEVNNG